MQARQTHKRKSYQHDHHNLTNKQAGTRLLFYHDLESSPARPTAPRIYTTSAGQPQLTDVKFPLQDYPFRAILGYDSIAEYGT